MQHVPKTELRYITSSEKEVLWNLMVNTVGFESIADHASYPLSGHPQGYNFNFERGRVLHEYQLLYITKGKGQFTSKSTATRQIQEGTVIFLFPGEWHTYRPDELTGWESYWVGFSGDFAGRLFAGNNISADHPVLSIGYDEEIVNLYKKIQEVSNYERPGYQQLLSGLVVYLLTYLFYREKDKNWKGKDVPEKIDKARLIIREKLNTSISPEQIARSLNMSYTWFRRTFRQYTGLAPAQYITQLKTKKAKEMLSVSNKTIKEIAIELGFESIDYFSTQFRKQTGQTPTQFRAMCRESPGN